MTFLGLCGLFTVCSMLLAGYTLWLLHKPDSPLRAIALRASSALFAVVIVPAYVLSAEFAGALLLIPGILTRYIAIYALPMLIGAASGAFL